MSLVFRWLGVAGIELKAGEQVLVIDPFFTRPGARGFFKPVVPNARLAIEKVPAAQYVLVTHSHWDHLMDVPAILRHSGAAAYGSANTCQLLRLEGVPEPQVNAIQPGDQLSLGAFKVEVIPGQHSWIPFAKTFNGPLTPGLKPPLRLQDYHMDTCLGFCISVMGRRILVCAAQPRPADILFPVAQEPARYYLQLFKTAQPQVVVPIHWDDFLSPLSRPLRRFSRPGRLQLWQLASLARHIVPGVEVILPEIFKEYLL